MAFGPIVRNRPFYRLIAPSLAWLLAACVATYPCPNSGLAALQCSASRGSKDAQLSLGQAYEIGAGVRVDPERAADLYRAAARAISGTIWVYSPPVGDSPGRVIPLNTGPNQPCLPEAKCRLAALYAVGRGVQQDTEKATRLREEAECAH